MIKPLRGAQLDKSHPINRGLVACFLFNEGDGKKVFDLSGNGNHGTINNMAFPPTATSGWNAGRRGHALSFDGTDDYVDCGNDASLTSTTGSIEIWVKLNTTNNDEPFIFPVESTWSDYLRFYRSNGFVRVAIEDGNVFQTDIYTPASSLEDTNWHHIVVTQDGSAIKIYIDGVNQSLTGTNSAYWTNHLTLTNFYIGKDSWQPSVDGIIDQVRIYSRALTASDVKQLYSYEYAGFQQPCEAWLYAAAAGGSSIPVAMYNYRRLRA